MLPRNDPDRISIAFEDHRLVANAGLILPVTLAHHLGPGELVDNLYLDSGVGQSLRGSDPGAADRRQLGHKIPQRSRGQDQHERDALRESQRGNGGTGQRNPAIN